MVHPMCGKVVVADCDMNEVNSSPDEIGHGAIPTVVGYVHGEDVGDGPVAFHNFPGDREDSLVFVDEVAW